MRGGAPFIVGVGVSPAGLLTARHPFEYSSLHFCKLIIKAEFYLYNTKNKAYLSARFENDFYPLSYLSFSGSRGAFL